MNDPLKTYSGFHRPNASYEEGACDFCNQNRVKVRPLLCMRHFFCRVCEEFSPKIKRRDFRCNKCSSKIRKAEKQNQKLIDQCLTKPETGKKKPDFHEVTINLGGAHVVTFDEEDKTKKNTGRKDRNRRKPSCKTNNVCLETYQEIGHFSTSGNVSLGAIELSNNVYLVGESESESTDDDLAGNNAEWDRIFEDFVGKSENYEENQQMDKCLKSSSKFVLPSQAFTTTENGSLISERDMTSAAKVSDRTSIETERYEVDESSSTPTGCECQSYRRSVVGGTPYPRYARSDLSGMTEDTEELERGTSPVKAYKPRYTLDTSLSPLQRELDGGIWDIEGPSPSSRSSLEEAWQS